ncbi:MAG: helix-turn-helix domain-containing protein [Lachnospiraceae bacterium]
MGKTQFAIADTLTAADLKTIRSQLKMTQKEFAALVNVTNKTIERWESSDKEITGPIVPLVKILRENTDIPDMLRVPEKRYPIRLWYMYNREVCTIIDVNELERKVAVYNYTNNIMFRAFGKITNPTFEQYEEFLESRCFPRTRDKMKLMLREMDLPFYDPLMIIEKTQGKMAEDQFWIRIER